MQISSTDFSPKTYWFLLLSYVVLILVAIWAFQYYHIWDFGPISVHTSRQADGAAQTLYLYQNGLTLLHSGISVGSQGAVAIEFPLFYNLAAVGYHIFGEHDVILRLLHYAVLLFGIFYLGKSLFSVFQNQTYPVLLIWGYLLFSPLLAFYGFNFLPNTAALGLVFWSAGLYLNFEKTQKMGFFYGAIGVMTLAGMIKPTVLIFFLAWLGSWVACQIFHRHYAQRTTWFPAVKTVIICTGIVLGFNVGWLAWSSYFNEYYSPGSGYYLRSTAAIFSLDWDEIVRQWNDILRYHLAKVFSRPIAYTLAVFSFLMLFLLPKVSLFMRWFYLFSFAGTIATFCLFFRQYLVHDYYLIDSYPFFLLVIGMTLYFVVQFTAKQPFFRWLLYGFLTFSITNSLAKTMSYIRHVYGTEYLMNGRIPAAFHRQYELHDFLKQLGVVYSTEKMSIVLPANDPNTHLYKCNTRGWPVFPWQIEESHLTEMVKWPSAHWLIVTDKDYLEEKALQAFLKKPMGSFNDEIFVFSLKD